MLTDALATATRALKEELTESENNPTTNYPDEVMLEVKEIMNRIDALKFKLDCPLWCNGYRYEDGVNWKA